MKELNFGFIFGTLCLTLIMYLWKNGILFCVHQYSSSMIIMESLDKRLMTSSQLWLELLLAIFIRVCTQKLPCSINGAPMEAGKGVKLALLCRALEASRFASNKASPLPLGYKLHGEVNDTKIFLLCTSLHLLASGRDLNRSTAASQELSMINWYKSGAFLM